MAQFRHESRFDRVCDEIIREHHRKTEIEAIAPESEHKTRINAAFTAKDLDELRKAIETLASQVTHRYKIRSGDWFDKHDPHAEAAQIAAHYVVSKLDKYETGKAKSFYSWASKVMGNSLKQYSRAQQRRFIRSENNKYALEDVENLRGGIASGCGKFELEVERWCFAFWGSNRDKYQSSEDVRKALEKAIRKNPEQATIYKMRKAGSTYKAIAARLGITETLARQKWHRLFPAMRREMARDSFERPTVLIVASRRRERDRRNAEEEQRELVRQWRANRRKELLRRLDYMRSKLIEA